MSKKIYLNNALTGNIPTELMDKFNRTAKKWSSSNYYPYELRDQISIKTKKNIAKFFNTSTNQIALTPNFTVGINNIVQILPQNKKVLLYKEDYPSVVEPFKGANFKICWYQKNNLEALKKAIDKHKPAIVAISITHYMSGYTYPVQELNKLAKKHKCIFILDATQTAGLSPLDFKKLKDIDVIISSGYKWLLGGYGNGFVHVSKDFQKKWIKENYFLERIEIGNLSHYGVLQLNLGLEYIMKEKTEKRLAYTKNVMTHFYKGLQKKGIDIHDDVPLENLTGICSIKGTQKLHNKLNKAGFENTFRNGLIRISFYIFNNKKEVDKLLAVL